MTWEYSEEENSKVELKSEANDAANSSAKDEKGEEKPDTKGTVTGERQRDGQVSTHQRYQMGSISIRVLEQGLLSLRSKELICLTGKHRACGE